MERRNGERIEEVERIKEEREKIWLSDICNALTN